MYKGIWMDFKGQQHLNLFSRHQIYVKIHELSSLHWIQISLLIQTYLHVLQWKGTNSILDGQSFVERVKYKTNCVQKSYGIKAKRPQTSQCCIWNWGKLSSIHTENIPNSSTRKPTTLQCTFIIWKHHKTIGPALNNCYTLTSSIHLEKVWSLNLAKMLFIERKLFHK